MSKFHVGDRVRLHDVNSEHHNKLGEVDTVYENGKYWVVWDRQKTSPQAANLHEEKTLRPAIIVTLPDSSSNWQQMKDLHNKMPIVKTGDIVHLMKRTGNEEPEVGDKVEIHSNIVGEEAIDSVNHPSHYNRFPVEVIEFTEQLDFNKGNAVKYLARAGYKEGVDELEDLSKAAWYVNRAIEKLKKERENG